MQGSEWARNAPSTRPPALEGHFPPLPAWVGRPTRVGPVIDTQDGPRPVPRPTSHPQNAGSGLHAGTRPLSLTDIGTRDVILTVIVQYEEVGVRRLPARATPIGLG
jgi:hypothetical protein